MADNVLITPGTGNTIAADEVTDGTLGTVKVQYVKIMDGTLDGTAKAAVGAGGLATTAAQSGTWTVGFSASQTVGIVAGAAKIGQVAIDQTTPGTTNLVQIVVTGTSQIRTVPTVTSGSAYAAGNEVGALLTFALALGTAQSGTLQSIMVSCKTVQTCTFALAIFTTNPTNTTWTDKSTPSINASDIPFHVGTYTLGPANSMLGTETTFQIDGIGKALAAASTSLYGILVVTIGTPTFTSTTDIAVILGVIKD